MPGILKVTRLPQPLSFDAGLDLQRQEGQALVAAPAAEARLLLLEHLPVYTLGRSTQESHLPVPEEALAARTGACVRRVDRGGSVTYHGPGQLTAYLLLNLQAWGLTVHQHLWNLEEAARTALATFGLQGQRVEGWTGVWVAAPRPEVPRSARPGTGGSAGQSLGADPGTLDQSRPADPLEERTDLAKVCAVGVSVRRWVTYHGLSLNLDPDLAAFSWIDPCGLGQRPVTSLSLLLGRRIQPEEAIPGLVSGLAELLQARVEPAP